MRQRHHACIRTLPPAHLPASSDGEQIDCGVAVRSRRAAASLCVRFLCRLSCRAAAAVHPQRQWHQTCSRHRTGAGEVMVQSVKCGCMCGSATDPASVTVCFCCCSSASAYGIRAVGACLHLEQQASTTAGVAATALQLLGSPAALDAGMPIAPYPDTMMLPPSIIDG
jgi:hypothetical protein